MQMLSARWHTRLVSFGLAPVAMAAVMAFGLATPVHASDASDMHALLVNANNTINNLHSDPAFGAARSMLDNAKAVYIVPKLVKGGFVFGAEGGDGVLLKRQGKSWSAPKFYTMGSASFGLQIGLEQAQLVFIINSDRALSGIEDGNFKIGANAGITVVNLSSGAEAATTIHGGDIVVWTSGSGAYAGLTFNGTVISPDKSLNALPANGPETQRLRANLANLL